MVRPREVQALLEERPDLESGLEAILEPEEPWSFEDVDVDSGRFGELVARGVVEETDGGYRVTDRQAVTAALAGDAKSGPSDQHSTGGSFRGVDPFSSVSRREVGLLLGALALVFVFRTIFSYPQVFQNGHVVLSGNDPYYYRYWVELLLTDPKTTLSTLPGTVLLGEPLMVTTLWLASRVLGGTVEAAGLVLAWYPVFSALVTALFVYAIAVVVTDDRRIGLAAVAMLAVLPGHAFRTSLGFADHHAFDYPWLVLTLLGVTLIVTTARHATLANRRRAGGIASIAVGVTGQVLAWEAGPLLIAPLGLWLAADALRAVHASESPLPTAGPVLVGAGLAAALTWTVHVTLGWHTTLVASAPALLTVAGLGVLMAGELAHRFDVPAFVLAAVEAFGLVAGAYTLATLWPKYWTRLTTSLESRLLARREIAEVQSLFADSGGWLLLFGLLLFLGIPYLVWATNRSRTHERWLPAVVYGWAFFVLSVVQVRFVGEFAPIIAVFCGLGFVHLAAWIDAAEPPTPFLDAAAPALTMPRGRQLRVLVVLFLLVTSLSIIQVPVKTGQVTTPQDQYEATEWMLQHESELNRSYPANYVFSSWGNSRLYNYFVNGHARSYGFAQSNWETFVTDQDGAVWYQRLRNRVGYLVLDRRDSTTPAAIGTRLYQHYGSRTGDTEGLAHYRARYVAGNYKVFTLTPGAVITGTAKPNTTVQIQTKVDIPGASFEYRRTTTTTANGTYTIRVPYPGEYTVGNERVSVPESAVANGSTITV